MWSLSTKRNQVSLQYQNVKPQYYKKSSKFTVPECEASVLNEIKWVYSTRMWSLNTTRNQVSLLYQNVKPQYYKKLSKYTVASILQEIREFYQNVKPQYCKKLDEIMILNEGKAAILQETSNWVYGSII